MVITMNINSIKFLKPEEINSMPMAAFDVTRSVITVKDTEIKRDVYSAEVKLGRLTKFKINLSSDDFALLCYFTKKPLDGYIPNQFSTQAHVRIVETKWPERGEKKAHSSYIIQVYLDEDLKWEFDITDTQFLKNFLKGVEAGVLKEFAPAVKIPGSQEKEVRTAQDLQEDAPVEEGGEKLPF